jgi:hypothetical protein
MNMSHVITEFSFGKYFPEITQPLDNSFEVTHDSASLASRDLPLLMCLQNLSRINITCVSFQQPMLPQGPSLYIQISIASHTTNDSSNRIRVSQESSSNLTSSPSVSPSSSAPPHLPNSSSGASLRLPFASPRSSHVSSTAVSALSVAYSSAHPGASAQQTA